jgi:cystathionine beta-lyase/cystathionine gamma-synthase
MATEREAIVRELVQVLELERERVVEQRRAVLAEQDVHEPSPERTARAALAALLAHAEGLLTHAAHELDLAQGTPGTHHNLLLVALRTAAFARAAGLRHTPPLAGTPAALSPTQRAGPRSALFSDYARSGSILREAPELEAHVRAERHPILRAVEEHLARVVWGDPPPTALLYSSGMGAISSALEYLASDARARGTRVWLGRASWMEVRSFASADLGDVVDSFDEHDPAAWARAALAPEVSAVCSETVVNAPELPIATARPLRTDQVLLIDAAHTPEYRPPGPHTWSVISGVKCLGAGLDLGKSGVLALHQTTPDELDALLERRERSGRVPSYEEAFLAGLDTAASFAARQARLDRNTAHIATRLAQSPRAAAVLRSAWLPTHPQHAEARALYGTGGRFVYLRVARPREVEDRLLVAAAQASLPLAAACTFGLAVPLLSVIVHPTAGTVLRISPGSEPLEVIERLADVVCAVLEA